MGCCSVVNQTGMSGAAIITFEALFKSHFEHGEFNAYKTAASIAKKLAFDCLIMLITAFL